MIRVDGVNYEIVQAEPSFKDLCYQCDYMMNEGFICGACPGTPCSEENHTVLKEVVICEGL